jgi:uncharacterized protein involved in propanediol utilization
MIINRNPETLDLERVITRCEATLCGKRGELVQGQTSAQLNFLCAMPFPIPGSVIVSLVPEKRIATEPDGMHKSARFARHLLDLASLEDVGATIAFSIHEKIGVGCGTSSQMMQLVYTALAAAGCAMLNPTEYGRLAAAIEPTDIFCPNGSTLLWEYKRGLRLGECFDLPMGSYVAGYPLDEILPTENVDLRRPRYTEREIRLFDDIFAEFAAVARRGDTRALGEMTSTSADINDEWFPKEALPNLRRLVVKREADGYFVAHSGTVVGAFIGDPERCESLLASFSAAVGRGYDVAAFQVTSDSRKRPFLFGAGRSLRRMVT